MGLKDLIDNLTGCKHEYETVGTFKKLKCKKCKNEIMVKE